MHVVDVVDVAVAVDVIPVVFATLAVAVVAVVAVVVMASIDSSWLAIHCFPDVVLAVVRVAAVTALFLCLSSVSLPLPALFHTID